jgi:hypothetical protein
MSILEDVFKGGNIGTGVAVGIGAAIAAPVILPLLRPISRAVLKAGLVAYDQGRAALADANEWGSDMIAEARSDMAQAGDGQAAQTSGPRRTRSEAEPRGATPAM